MTFPRTLSQEDIQPGQNPGLCPQIVGSHSRIEESITHPVSLILTFFFSLWFYLISDDFLPHCFSCVCVPSFYPLPSYFCFSLPFFCPCRVHSPDCKGRNFPVPALFMA